MIHGNTRMLLQVKTVVTNAIGEHETAWETVQILFGWLDLQVGGTNFTTYNAKIQESTHIFIADYVELSNRIKAENSRAVIDGHVYDITLIDDPMNMHQHWEIFLKYTGGQ